MQVNKILKLISAINDTGRVASDMYDLDKKYYHSQSKDEYIPIAEMDIQYLIRAFIKLINRSNDTRLAENLRELCQENDEQEKETKELNKQLLYQEKIIDGLRSQVKTLQDKNKFLAERLEATNKAWYDVTYVKGCRYVFSEIPNDTEGQEFVDTCKKYLNRESYALRVKGQHIKDELKGQGRTAYGQNLSESSCMRIYIDTKKGE